MKGLIPLFSALLQDRAGRSNLRSLLRLLAILLVLVSLFSGIFHVIMMREGQEHSWLTGLYWTLTVMSTLGFGDITFESDLGRLFSVVVLVTGVVYMLVLLPFTFIEFFYAPWMRAQAAARAPRELPPSWKQHVILTHYDALASALIPMLDKHGHPYVVLCSSPAEAIDLDDRGIRSAVGDLDDPDTYRRMRIDQAALLVTTRTDMVNANVTFTARELAPRLPIVASANSSASRDVLELAGATLVLRLEEMMGTALARRISLRDSHPHLIGSLGGLHIAEASAAGTTLVGQTLRNSQIRSRTGVNVIGTWNRGAVELASPDLVITENTLLILAGTKQQLEAFDRVFSTPSQSKPHIIVIGGGRVGRATYRALKELGLCTVSLIERNPDRVRQIPEAIIGDATEMEVLKQASAREASSLIITTHDDDTNVALTIFFRRLRSSFQILARSNLDRNVATLHRAGADLVLSFAAMGSNTVLNVLRGSDHLLLAEGVNIFPTPIPPSMAGRLLSDLDVRALTGCSIIAVETDHERVDNPPPDYRLPENGRIFLIGDIEAEDRFLKRFIPAVHGEQKKWWTRLFTRDEHTQ